MKDKKVKLSTKIFRTVVSLLFVVFITLFLSNKYGYYEYKKHEQVALTEEQITKFEQDVKEGKDIDIESYLSNTNPSYQTKFSKMGLRLSDSISKVVKGGVESFFKSINKVVTEDD